MNNPSRSNIYFPDSFIEKISSEENLVQESEREDGVLEIEAPTQTGIYVASVDTATANGKDKNALIINKIDGIFIEEVLNIEQGKTEAGDFALKVLPFLKKYNNASIIPERNYPGNEFIFELSKH
jgi:hypothetical protein